MFASFHLKDFMLLECYILKKINFEKFYLIVRYWFNDILLYFGRFYVIERFRFYEISLIFMMNIFRTNKIYKQKF